MKSETWQIQNGHTAENVNYKPNGRRYGHFFFDLPLENGVNTLGRSTNNHRTRANR